LLNRKHAAENGRTKIKHFAKTEAAMAIGYIELKNINRSSGRSAVAAAAYRAHERLTDERTGELFDFTPRQKTALAESFLLFPDGEKGIDRAALWNAAEAAENRKNSTTARELICALPRELDDAQQRQLSESFARFLTESHGVACDGSIHRNDTENPHLHLLFTTRRYCDGKLQEKTRELDVKGTSSQCVESMREQWQKLTNEGLKAAGFSEEINMRSYARQGLDKAGERKRTRRQSEAVKEAHAARMLAREARFLERDAEDLESKARRRRNAAMPKAEKPAVAKDSSSLKKESGAGRLEAAAKAPRRVRKPAFSATSHWGAGEPEKGSKALASVSTGKARKVVSAIAERFPHARPADIYRQAFPAVIGAFGSGACGMASPAAFETPSSPAAACGMLPPPSGLSPDAYAAWLYAYKRALTVSHDAKQEQRERSRMKL
jgi:hypothetical protein